jgi:hypothetical protein
MAYSYTEKKRIRKDFGKHPKIMDASAEYCARRTGR